MTLTQQRLKELLHYDPATGLFTWRVKRNNKALAGQIAGNVGNHGYVQIYVDRANHLAHRLAWLYVNGVLPADKIDHRNGVRTDNRWANLRECDHAENMQNQGVRSRSDNKSGHIGVCGDSRRPGKWRATIKCGKKYHHLGTFDTVEAAADAYRKAKLELHTFNPELTR